MRYSRRRNHQLSQEPRARLAGPTSTWVIHAERERACRALDVLSFARDLHVPCCARALGIFLCPRKSSRPDASCKKRCTWPRLCRRAKPTSLTESDLSKQRSKEFHLSTKSR